MKMTIQNSNSGNSINKPLNIEYVVRNGLCVGCGICGAACPNEAINVFFDGKCGVPLPIVGNKKCSECQRCLHVCYGYKVDSSLNLRVFGTSSSSILGNSIKCYTGYATDQQLRFNSASGGVVTALLVYALKQGLIDGAIVTRMEAGSPPKAKAFIATTVGEVLSSRGSKYCPVSFAECLKNLENKKKYAVVGLPCHIYGIRKLAESNAKIRNSVSLYLGIFCDGMPSYLGTLYILKRYKMAQQYITKFEYRGGGWPGRLLIRGRQPMSEKQSEIHVPYPQYWNDSFGFFLPYRCTLCHDGFNEFSDISCGDAWLPRFMHSDKQGTSSIVTRTEVGERLIWDAFKDGIVQINYINVQDVKRSQRGLIGFKFSTIKARINLCKASGRSLPIIDLSRTPYAKFDGYLQGILLYLGRTMAYNRDLWRFLDIYIAANSLLTYCKKLFKTNPKKDLD